MLYLVYSSVFSNRTFFANFHIDKSVGVPNTLVSRIDLLMEPQFQKSEKPFLLFTLFYVKYRALFYFVLIAGSSTCVVDCGLFKCFPED